MRASGKASRSIRLAMALFNLTDLVRRLGRGDRLLGIDPGGRRIGLALSDVTLAIASPYGTIARTRLLTNASEIRAIARAEMVGGLVVGLPLSMDGGFGPAAQAARDWAKALSDATALPAAMWDERLSSATASDLLAETGHLSRTRRARVLDRASAAVILQSALQSGLQSHVALQSHQDAASKPS